MGAALAIRDDLSAAALRRQARREPNRRAALRMLAIASALEGMSRAKAARLAGMERQALRDAVVRYNAEGLAGLYDRPKPGRSQRLSEAEQAALAAHIFHALNPEKDGVSAWTRADLSCWLEARFGKTFHPSSLSRVLRRLTYHGRKPGRCIRRPIRRHRRASEKGAA
jgi:transposase